MELLENSVSGVQASILFPSNSSGIPYCQPNSELSGVLVIKNAHPLNPSEINLFLTGREKVLLSPNSHSIKNSPESLGNKASGVNAFRKNLFSIKLVLWRNLSNEGEAQLILPGIYSFHFVAKFKNANFPESISLPESKVSYFFDANMIFPNKSNAPINISTAPINFIPKVISPIYKPNIYSNNTLNSAPKQYLFSDNIIDPKSGKILYFMEVTSLDIIFRTGQYINITIKLTGKKSLFSTVANLIGQSDCFYPHSPSIENNHDFLLSTDRIWSKAKLLTKPINVIFDRSNNDTPVTQSSKKSESLKVFSANVQIGPIPDNISALPETFYMRHIVYIQLVGLVNSSWGSSKSISALIPIPISNVLNYEDNISISKPTVKPSELNKRNKSTDPTKFTRSLVPSDKNARKKASTANTQMSNIILDNTHKVASKPRNILATDRHSQISSIRNYPSLNTSKFNSSIKSPNFYDNYDLYSKSSDSRSKNSFDSDDSGYFQLDENFSKAFSDFYIELLNPSKHIAPTISNSFNNYASPNSANEKRIPFAVKKPKTNKNVKTAIANSRLKSMYLLQKDINDKSSLSSKSDSSDLESFTLLNLGKDINPPSSSTNRKFDYEISQIYDTVDQNSAINNPDSTIYDSLTMKNIAYSIESMKTRKMLFSSNAPSNANSSTEKSSPSSLSKVEEYEELFPVLESILVSYNDPKTGKVEMKPNHQNSSVFH
ncbi:hypothetical protein AYI69_g4128 [Smittium culicis]|uniref:Uncharacterized protein n=1 Tax=Smittium culicis TaxID=133412 RepID=A0A1R1YG99_9FUNG|nr:hypothetical protein AYI69_g4128 [Smittium culicis]